MSTGYLWDLGFDWNAAQNTDGTFELNQGLVIFPPNAPATPDAIPQNSPLGFNLFNTTSGSMAGGSFSIDHLWITFSANLDGQTTSCLFTSGNISTSSLTVEPPGPSTIFGLGPFPCWNFAAQSTANAGSYRFTVFLTVNGPDGSGGTTEKIFRVDPEMIVEAPPTPET
jgi:hypothetical protein